MSYNKMVLPNPGKAFNKYHILGFVLLILAIILINIGRKYEIKYLAYVSFVIVLVSMIIIPNWLRRYDKEYTKDYTPKKDIKIILMVLLGLLFLGLALVSQLIFNLTILGAVFFVLFFIPLIYVFVRGPLRNPFRKN